MLNGRKKIIVKLKFIIKYKVNLKWNIENQKNISISKFISEKTNKNEFGINFEFRNEYQN